MGTGDNMNLQKRYCPIKMVLKPSGSCWLRLEWDIGGDHYSLLSSTSVMGGHFELFLQAVYCLYNEEWNAHSNPIRAVKQQWQFVSENATAQDCRTMVTTEFLWDKEGSVVNFRFSRILPKNYVEWNLEKDPVNVEIWYNWDRDNSLHSYVVEGRDLCYAIAKAMTDALKKYGIYGYYRSTSDSDNVCMGGYIDPEQFLFVKAYALSAMETRELTGIKDVYGDDSKSSQIDKEIELLLFEM